MDETLNAMLALLKQDLAAAEILLEKAKKDPTLECKIAGLRKQIKAVESVLT